jgi:hypothetical protein
VGKERRGKIREEGEKWREEGKGVREKEGGRREYKSPAQTQLTQHSTAHTANPP